MYYDYKIVMKQCDMWCAIVYIGITFYDFLEFVAILYSAIHRLF